MGLASGAIDLYMTYKFLRILTQRFEDTDAFKFGIIDKDGKILKKRNTLKGEEKNAYTIFHRLIWKIKRIMGKLPLGKTRLASYAAALWFVKEEASKNGMESPKDLENVFYKHLKENNALVDSMDLDEQLLNFLAEENLAKGTYKLKVSVPDGGVIDNEAGPDMEVGDFIDVPKDIEPIDVVLGVEIFKVVHRDSGKEIVVGRDDLFKVN